MPQAVLRSANCIHNITESVTVHSASALQTGLPKSRLERLQILKALSDTR